jgi:hypothetical protein
MQLVVSVREDAGRRVANRKNGVLARLLSGARFIRYFSERADPGRSAPVRAELAQC